MIDSRLRIRPATIPTPFREGSRGTLPKDVDRGRLLIRIGPDFEEERAYNSKRY